MSSNCCFFIRCSISFWALFFHTPVLNVYCPGLVQNLLLILLKRSEKLLLLEKSDQSLLLPQKPKGQLQKQQQKRGSLVLLLKKQMQRSQRQSRREQPQRSKRKSQRFRYQRSQKKSKNQMLVICSTGNNGFPQTTKSISISRIDVIFLFGIDVPK